MKTALKILATAMVAMFFSSCSQQAMYYDASGNIVSSTESLSAEGKNVAPPVVESKPKRKWFCCPEDQKPKAKVAKVRKPRVKKAKAQGCTSCLSVFCPEPGCCGTVGDGVLSRATMQGGTGEPQLGLIPTMKTLAPEL
ncbi:MAG: hypothetical protein ABGY95_11955 [Rubritalea sp.]|uniref:hypothetical protein n=1 Tax=Rubritalea sp. TaxID=2109375 RepID=UPI003242F55E